MIITLTPIQVILEGMGAVTTAITSVVGSVISVIVGQPLLLIPVLVGFIGMGFGLLQKLRHG